MKRFLWQIASLALFALVLAPPNSVTASDLLISPTTGTLNVTRWEVTDNSNLDSNDLESITGFSDLELLYKSNQGSTEEGPYENNYETVFLYNNQNALVVYGGGESIQTPTKVLVVKDGNNNPGSYVFDISNWDGEMTLMLRNFWECHGSISNIAIHGSEQVPEPATLASLASLALCLGVCFVRRQRRSQS